MQSKRLVIFIIVGLLLCGAGLMAQTPDVVAVVNGEKITKNQLVQTLLDWRGLSTLEDMIQMKLIDQEAKKAKVVVTQQEINARITELKNSLPPNANFDDFLRSRGLTPSRLAAIFKMQLQAEKIVGRNIKVTQEDLANYIRASHILVAVNPPPNATDEEKAKLDQEALAKINTIAAEIKSGAISFEEAAKKYSDDTGTKNNGGDLNWFAKGQMVPAFEKACLALSIGQISDPVKTDFGYHLIKLTGLGDKASPEDKKMLEEEIMRIKMNEELPKWLDSVRKNAKIENYLVPSKSGSAASTAKPAAKPANNANDSDISLPPPPPGK